MNKEETYIVEEIMAQSRILRSNLKLLDENGYSSRLTIAIVQSRRYMLLSAFSSVLLIIFLISTLVTHSGEKCFYIGHECLNRGILSLILSFLSFLSLVVSLIFFDKNKQAINDKKYLSNIIQRGEAISNLTYYINH